VVADGLAGRAATPTITVGITVGAANTVRWCACGARIVGAGYVEATNPPGGGPRLCLSCAVDHARERPGDITTAPAAEPPPDQPAPDQPAPDQPAPDQPAPDQPAPDQPAPDQPAPDQPAQPHGGRTGVGR
jgi:hypothetical protein